MNATCGHRVTIASNIFSRLKEPNYLQVQFTNKHIVIGTGLDEENEKFGVRVDGKSKAKAHIYNKALVEEITEEFNLDFKGITSRSFGDIEHYEQGGANFVTVRMK